MNCGVWGLPVALRQASSSKPSIREQTAYYYNNYIEKHIVAGIRNIKLDKLTPLQIQQFYNKLKTSGWVQRYEHIELKDKEFHSKEEYSS